MPNFQPFFFFLHHNWSESLEVSTSTAPSFLSFQSCSGYHKVIEIPLCGDFTVEVTYKTFDTKHLPKRGQKLSLHHLHMAPDDEGKISNKKTVFLGTQKELHHHHHKLCFKAFFLFLVFFSVVARKRRVCKNNISLRSLINVHTHTHTRAKNLKSQNKKKCFLFFLPKLKWRKSITNSMFRKHLLYIFSL